LWKKATPQHIMKWRSPWKEGYPGWQRACSAMGAKSLGIPFDIHGGGLDLMFPHHESEIAQSMAAFGQLPCKYWIHNNLITINGQKMAKSLGNFITLEELFTGNHRLLDQAYQPMVIRFFILQAHYRSTIDFSNDALKAAEKGLARLTQAQRQIEKLMAGNQSSFNVDKWISDCYEVMNDDLNTAKLIAELFEASRHINLMADNKEFLTGEDLEKFRKYFNIFLTVILGLSYQESQTGSTDELIKIIIELRKNAREKKDFATSDFIRDKLKEIGIQLKDGKEGTSWEYLM